jgi:ATP-dependent RNA helicase HrpB
VTATFSHLPIGPTLPKLIDALGRFSSAVLRAPTGSGKTTRVPPALLDAGLAGDSDIVMLEPRRVAARAAARRIARERDGLVGQEVGYAVRFDQKIGPNTRIKIVTDGVLLRLLQDDPFLEQASIVIFDEFHERGLNADLALALVRRVQQTVRPELKIVVMSATLAVEPIAEFLGKCPILESEGRLFPVEIRYQQAEDARPIAERAAAAVQHVLPETDGDVLVFLPGVGEIRRTSEQLMETAARQNLAVMELYGDLTAEQQDATLRPIDRRKIVLATNVAETSITIEGISAVVDTGLARFLQYDPSVGLDRLVLTRVSRASADQRAGRAGRTQAGLCLRLWTERDHWARPAVDEPEVRRVDVAGPVLQLLEWGEPDPSQFPWFEAPAAASFDRAQSLLSRLGAIKDDRLSDVGRAIVRLPVHPRIGRLLVEGERYAVSSQAAMVGALLSERDPFLRERLAMRRSGPAATVRRSFSDVLDRVLALEEFERTGRVSSVVGQISIPAARHILRTRDQLLSLLSEQSILRAVRLTKQRSTKGRQSGVLEDAEPGRGVVRTSRSGSEFHGDEALLRSIFAAFPDRLARRREPGARGGVMREGRGVRLADSSGVMEADLFVCVDVAADKSEFLVRLASSVERDWLPADRLVTVDEYRFDPVEERVMGSRRTTWDGLVLDEVPIQLPGDHEVAAILAEAAAQSTERVLPQNDTDWDNFLARVRSLRQWMPQLGLPEFNDDQFRDLLPEICRGRRSFAELRKAPWIDFLRGKLTFKQNQALDQHAPERLTVPSGSRIALLYEAGRPPVLAVRIQELFGLVDTPRIAGGRVSVLLHLLAPNMRPQQVTDDLESFWTNTYPKIRSELRRRYPKHAWPEDPRSASAQRKPGNK